MAILQSQGTKSDDDEEEKFRATIGGKGRLMEYWHLRMEMCPVWCDVGSHHIETEYGQYFLPFYLSLNVSMRSRICCRRSSDKSTWPVMIRPVTAMCLRCIKLELGTCKLNSYVAKLDVTAFGASKPVACRFCVLYKGLLRRKLDNSWENCSCTSSSSCLPAR